MKLNMKAILAAVTTLGLIACGGAPEKQTGILDVSISGPSTGSGGSALRALVTGTADAAGSIRSVWLTISGPNDFEAPRCITTDDQAIRFPLVVRQDGLVAGAYTVTATAYSEICSEATNQLYSQTIDATVEPRARTNVALVMQQTVHPKTVNVTAPFIRGIAITGTPAAIGHPVHLVASVDGPPTAEYYWVVSCPGDATLAPFSARTAATTDLTLDQCASDAEVTFSVTVWNAPGTTSHLTSAVSFVIPYVAQGIDVTGPGITLNSFPNIYSITAMSNTEPPAGSGNPVWLVADVSDPDGDNFVAQWSDNCGGTFQIGYSATQLDKYWYYPSTLAAGSVCTITLTVTETGNAKLGHNFGSNAATFTLMIAPTISVP